MNIIDEKKISMCAAKGIARLCEKKEMTQKAFSIAASYPETALSNAIKGRRKLSIFPLLYAANIFGVKVDDLFVDMREESREIIETGYISIEKLKLINKVIEAMETNGDAFY